MSDLSVKPNKILDSQVTNSAPSAVAQTMADLANTFRDLVGRFSNNLDPKLSEISGKSEFKTLGYDIERRNASKDSRDDIHKDDHNRSFDEPVKDRPDRDRFSSERVERNEPDNHRDNSDNRADIRDPNNEERDHSNYYNTKDDHSTNGNSTKDNRDAIDGGDQNSHRSGGAETASKPEKNGQSISQTNINTENTELWGGGTLTAQLGAAGSLNTVSALNLAGRSAEAEPIRATDTSIVSSQAALAATATGAQKKNGERNQSSTNQGSKIQSTQQNLEQRISENTQLQQQREQLTKTLDKNTNVKIDVSINKEAESLSSRPATTLTAGAALAASDKGQNRIDTQANRQSAVSPQHGVSHQNAQYLHGGVTQSQSLQPVAQSMQGQAGATVAINNGGGSNSLISGQSAGSILVGNEQANAGNSVNTANSSVVNQQTQQTTQTLQTQQSAKPQHSLQASVAEQISIKITKALQAGQDRITIRLNPAELGRVEVKMELAHDGRTTAIVTADNRDTLDMLRRDSSSLQRALQESGMQLSHSDLSFNLRDQREHATEESGEKGSEGNSDEENLVESSIEDRPEVIAANDGSFLINGRIDVRA